MTVRRRSRIWTQQPQALTGIDRSDSITRDLCFVQSGGLGDIFTNVGTTQKPTTRGVVRSFDAALSQYMLANNGLVIGPALTFFALFSINNLTGNLALLSVGGPASSRHLFYVAPEGVLALFSGEGGSYGQAQSATWALPDTTQYYFAVGRVSANNSRDIWVNGKRVVSDSTSVAVSPANIDRVAIGAYWNNGAPIAGFYFDGSIALAGTYSRALSDAEIVALSANPWQIFAKRSSRRLISSGGGSVNANASGAFSTVSVTAPTVSASGSASATGALAAITISAPTATASAGGSAAASGSFAALSITPATATATATTSATASGAFAAISLSATSATATVTKSATASGAFVSLSISAPTATATGSTAGGANAIATPAQITISPATAIAIGSAVASGGYQSIGITAPNGSASVVSGNATASGAWADISLSAATGYASSGFIRAPAGNGPVAIHPGSYRPSNTGGRRY